MPIRKELRTIAIWRRAGSSRLDQISLGKGILFHVLMYLHGGIALPALDGKGSLPILDFATGRAILASDRRRTPDVPLRSVPS